MASEAITAALAWVRRAPPRSLDDAPAIVRRHLEGTKTSMRVLWGTGLFVALLMGLTGMTLQEKALNFAGAAVFISFGLLALTRGIQRTTRAWLALGRAESRRVSAVETVTVRDARSASRIQEVTLVPRDGGAPLFAYAKVLPPHVTKGLEVVVLVRGARALVFGLGDELLIAVAVPLHRS